jgi:hypothetical protein
MQPSSLQQQHAQSTTCGSVVLVNQMVLPVVLGLFGAGAIALLIRSPCLCAFCQNTLGSLQLKPNGMTHTYSYTFPGYVTSKQGGRCMASVHLIIDCVP